MPTRSIVTDGQFDPIAVFIVLATMCHPLDSYRRNRMISTIRRGTGVGKVSVAVLDDTAYLHDVKEASGKAFAAAFVFKEMVRQHQFGRTISRNAAIEFARPLLPEFEQAIGANWSRDFTLGRLPTSRRLLIEAFNNYLTVLPLWAAMSHAYVEGDRNAEPDRNENLPRFLANAEWFLDGACRVPWQRERDRTRLLDRKACWRFPLPESLRLASNLKALPNNPTH